MKTTLIKLSAALVIASNVGASELLDVSAGAATGELYNPLGNAFDAQPVLNLQTGIPEGEEGGNSVPRYAGRIAYIDFGEQWHTVKIHEVWTLYRSRFSGTNTPYETMWWDNDIDKVNDSGFDETTLKINGAEITTTLEHPTWVKEEFNQDAPAIPLDRYLMIKTPEGISNAALEFAFVGEHVPHTKQIISPISASVLPGGLYFPLEHAFDAQPTLNESTGIPENEAGASNAPAYENRYGYIDFGPDYRSLRLTESWTCYRKWSSGDQNGFEELWWDDDTDLWNDGTTESHFNFNSATNLATGNNRQWVRDNIVEDKDAITPPFRYLIFKSSNKHTWRAEEFAFVGWIADAKLPEPKPIEKAPPLTHSSPETFNYDQLTLVDEVICATDTEHVLVESESDLSRITDIMGTRCRILPQDDQPAYFGYVLGKNSGLEAGKAYILVVEYPEDRSRSMTVVNQGCETYRGFYTGRALGDALYPHYVNNNNESINYGLSGTFNKWEQLFHLHDSFVGVKRLRSGKMERTLIPKDGFHVLISRFEEAQDPLSAGPAVSRIALYEAPDYEDYVCPTAQLPEGLPKRRLFWREEMADGVVAHKDEGYRGVKNDIDWYEYKARLHRFLGMNTFSKDLLEFGHNQGWDGSKYPGMFTPYKEFALRWNKIVDMLEIGDYGLDILPYYEYAGGTGYNGLGIQFKSEPLTGYPHSKDGGLTFNNWYTHISWSEERNIDVTDPEALVEAKKLLECTLTDVVTPRPELSPTPAEDDTSPAVTNEDFKRWGYIDFGPDYDQIRIKQTWTRAWKYAKRPATPFPQRYWSNSKIFTSIEELQTNGIEETQINFITQEQSSSGTWTKDMDLADAEVITPPSRYLLMMAPKTTSVCQEFIFVGWRNGENPAELKVITPVDAGSAKEYYDLARLFDNQPNFLTGNNIHVAGTWFRTRISDIPIGFGDETRARFAAEMNLDEVTRNDLKIDVSLLNMYRDWWRIKRMQFLIELRDYVRSNVEEDAVVLFTWDSSESGVSAPRQPDVITDNVNIWSDKVHKTMALDDALESQLHLTAMQTEHKSWATYEWNHSIPRGDFANYANVEGVKMTYSFNHLYTVPDRKEFDWINQFGPQNGANFGTAMIRHYSLNEDCMGTKSTDSDILGYFVTDMEAAGPYSMLAEARALAFGDPTYIGYLSSNSFNRGFPGYVRLFNANFLALPALPSEYINNASLDPEIIVKQIVTPNNGNWYVVINTSIKEKLGANVTLPTTGTITDAVTGEVVETESGILMQDLYPGQVRSFHSN